MAPCDILDPYFGIGVSGLYFSLEKGQSVKDGNYLDYQANLILGVNWGIIDEYLVDILGEGFSYNTEIAYHTVASDGYDGAGGTVGGLLGGSLDTYMTFKAGLIYKITEGKKYRYCDIYDGVLTINSISSPSPDNKNTNPDNKDTEPNSTVTNGLVDYNRIEDIIKRYVKEPANIDYNRIEDIVKRNKPSINFDGMPTNDKNATDGYAPNWVLMGINFEFNSTRFTPESYPILLNAFQILMANPSLRVEIQGHTDNIGSSEVNRKLSRDRADLVKQYLVSKGIAANRLSTSGFGAEKPIADNQTSMGRFLNRRIEFKVLGK
ncbi:MAG: OmpA family protein [Ignavibacteriales bacterium]|nr:MAG: OmpA family protein [Ignavibacteriales bacterium]